MDRIEQSVQHMSDKYDEELAEIKKKQNKDIRELKERVEKIENSRTQTVIEGLRQQVNYLQKYSRRQNLEVHGIPCLSNENLLNRLNKVAKLLDVAELTEGDIEAIHIYSPGNQIRCPQSYPFCIQNDSRPLVRK